MTATTTTTTTHNCLRASAVISASSLSPKGYHPVNTNLNESSNSVCERSRQSSNVKSNRFFPSSETSLHSYVELKNLQFEIHAPINEVKCFVTVDDGIKKQNLENKQLAFLKHQQYYSTSLRHSSVSYLLHNFFFSPNPPRLSCHRLNNLNNLNDAPSPDIYVSHSRFNCPSQRVHFVGALIE